MEETGMSTQQSGFGGDGSGGYNPPAATDTGTSTPSSNAETYTNNSSASESGGGSTPPAAATTGVEKNTVAQSEKGSFKLVYNERTGRNEVVSTMPEESSGSGQATSTAPTATYTGNELMQAAQQVANNPVPQPQNAEYSMAELQEAMRQGNVNEDRIPVDMRQNYYLAMAQQQQPAPPQQQQQAEESAQPEADTAKAQEFYSKVQQMAQDRAMKEIGITQDEIDVAEYTDDPELIQKARAYQVAIENNRAQILQDVDNIQRQQKAVEEDRARAYQTVVSFVDEMRKKEPNFDAIDRLMTSRVAKMPHEKAVLIEPLLIKVRNGQLSTADLPALQEMYNETRLEFYSQREGVGIAPQIQKPAYVEMPGSGGDVQKPRNSLADLGKLNKRDKIRAIGQMFGRSFLEDN